MASYVVSEGVCDPDLVWFVLDAEDTRRLVIAGRDSKPVLPVIGGAGLVA